MEAKFNVLVYFLFVKWNHIPSRKNYNRVGFPAMVRAREILD